MKPRACLLCYHRKIKCDRKQPCTNCVNSNEGCSFPQGKIRRNRPRRKAVAPLAEKRIALSETRLEELGNTTSSSSTTEDHEYMVVDNTSQSRLLAGNAWANVKEEEENFKDTLLNMPLENVSAPGPEQFLFNADQGHNLDAWIPSSAQLEACWLTYLADIDPLVRILHKPSVRKIIDRAQQTGLRTIDTASLTIVLAICFSAIASLDSVQCAFRFGEDGKSLLERCKISVQNAFSRARLVESHNIQVLQAFVVFITCLPRDGSRTMWTLIGLATRIATSLGLHRDGSNFSCFSPFEVEMRRRLWWHIRVLDVRASEDVGTAITGLIHSDTAFPGNLNDSDLDPATNIHPENCVGATEMSYALFGFDALKVFKKLSPSAKATIEEKEKTIEEFSLHCERSYLKHFDANQSSPIFRLGSKTVRILISKMRIQAYFQALRCQEPLETNNTLPSSSKVLEDIFSSAVSILEYQSQAASEEDLKGWRWLLGAYRQMHAMAFVLSQLSVRIDAFKVCSPDGCLPTPLPNSVQRAWRAVQAVFTEYNSVERSRPSWGPLVSLKRKIEQKLEIDNGGSMHIVQCDAAWTGWDAQILADLDIFPNVDTWQGFGYE